MVIKPSCRIICAHYPVWKALGHLRTQIRISYSVRNTAKQPLLFSLAKCVLTSDILADTATAGTINLHLQFPRSMRNLLATRAICRANVQIARNSFIMQLQPTELRWSFRVFFLSGGGLCLGFCLASAFCWWFCSCGIGFFTAVAFSSLLPH